jgi:hypothetical protein
MVQQGAFKVQLVEATSKNPFPEHSKDGMHFVEAEPNAEYYIRLEMIPCGSSSYSTSPYLMTQIKVDKHDLGDAGGRAWANQSRRSDHNFFPMSVQDGITKVQSLRFSPPDRFQEEDQSFSLDSYLEKMGRVEVHVYEGTLVSKNCGKDLNTKSSFLQYHENNAMVVPVSQNGSEREKFVLSKPGRKKMSADTLSRSTYNLGRCIDVIKLRYCTARGLILAGVITNPLSFTWRSGLPPRRSVSLSPEGSPSSMIQPNYHTEMHRFVGDPTRDGNVPYRMVEVIVIDDESDESDIDDDIFDM